MAELIIGGIRTKFEKKKQFKDFEPPFTESEILELEETVESCLNEIKHKEETIEENDINNLSDDGLYQLEQECVNLKNELEEKEKFNSLVLNKVISILDQVDEIHRYALEVEDNTLKQYLVGIKDQIDKEIKEIDIEEIKCNNEIINEEIHNCVQAVESEGKRQNEIVHVTQKGYLLKGEVFRKASVMAVK